MLFKSQLPSIELPEIALHEALQSRMESFGHDVAMVNLFSHEEYTYSQIVAQFKNAASGLVRLGLKKGDLLTYMCPNMAQCAVVYLATWACGGVVTTINPESTSDEMLYYLKDSRSSFLVTTKDLLPTVHSACEHYKDIKTIITIESDAGHTSFSDLITDDGAMYPHGVCIRPKEDPAMILYSSGTTGLPKGVMLTHYNLVSQIFVKADARSLQKEDYRKSMMGLLPFFHNGGTVGHLLPCLGNRVKLICVPKFEPESFLKGIEKYKVTNLVMVTPKSLFMIQSPLTRQYNLTSIRHALNCGSQLDEIQMEGFRTKFGVDFYSTYGMTEASWISDFPPNKELKGGSPGCLLANMDAKVVDLSGGQLLGPGEQGELCIRGPCIMKGYFNKPEATRDAIDSDGFLHTGDVVYIDEYGYLFIVGRLKEIIKCHGLQVSLAQLDGILLEHSDVTDAGVIGVPHPDGDECPRAYVVKKPGSTVTEAELTQFVAGKVSVFKRLDGGLVFIDALPRTPMGKLMRHKLRDIYRREHAV